MASLETRTEAALGPGKVAPAPSVPTKLHVYIDETVREVAGGHRLLGLGLSSSARAS
jgi:hypothetical protein